MTTSRPFHLLGLISLALFLLAGCSSAAASGAGLPTEAKPDVNAKTETGDVSPKDPTDWWVEESPRMDSQGAVEIVVTPLNLNAPWQSLDFSVAMNTHSVDLSMDLTTLAVLTTDTGLTLNPISWDAPLGGHHVAGTLSFPSTVDDVPVLEGVGVLTLTIYNIDAPERVFVWEK